MSKLLPYRILLIEDNLGNREVFSEILELQGYQVIPSKNGIEGLRLAEETNPSLIISDIQLPDISGFALLEFFKKTAKIREIPFLFLSAFSESKMINKGLALGANGYLVKPCSMQQMISTIHDILL